MYDQKRYINNQDIMTKTACFWSPSVYTSKCVLRVLWRNTVCVWNVTGLLRNLFAPHAWGLICQSFCTLQNPVTVSRGSIAQRELTCSPVTQVNLSVYQTLTIYFALANLQT